MGDAKVIPLPTASSAAPEVAPRTVDEALAMHLDALYATARFLCREPAASEDLVQDVALTAFQAWGSLRDPAASRTWLLRILHRKFLNTRRRERRRPPLHDIELDLALAEPLPDAQSSVPDLLEREQVALALQELPSGFGEVAWLVDALELRLAEAAEVLEIPTGTAASRLFRARRLLRERLARLREGAT